MTILEITSPGRNDQKPGTSGLRKKTRQFQEEHFLERYIQATFDATGGAAGKTYVVGGDGREWCREATAIIARMAAANGAARLIIGRDALLSTPAASNLIRKRKADGGLILSASHNPGGIDGDFGVKYNGANGGPATETVTDAIFAASQTDVTYRIVSDDAPSLGQIGTFRIGDMDIEVIDPVADYAELMQELFDFDAIRTMIAAGRTVRFDAMHAITGPYAKAILEDRLGCPPGTVINAVPLPDFGQGHPDPNPTWAHEIYNAVVQRSECDVAAASDGDGDRNMIVGAGTYVTPSDSLAIICEHATTIPAYAAGLDGVARSMPTSGAVDRVAAELGMDCYVTPTGWKFFGNLMDAGRITICGEESFGTGSTHVREKDGLWAFLCWLNIMAATGKSVRELVDSHWMRFGRTFYSRHDYEEVPQELADLVVAKASDIIANGADNVVAAENFSYTDPVDGSTSRNQGYRLTMNDGAKAIMRLSGTGTVGATIRLYFEQHIDDATRFSTDTQQLLADVMAKTEALLGVRALTGKSAPDVIT